MYDKQNNGKFFKRINPSDLKRYQDVESGGKRKKKSFLIQRVQFPMGKKRTGLLNIIIDTGIRCLIRDNSSA
jgi:hypothetical protein